MARLTFTVETGKSVSEMKSFIDTKILPRPEARIVLSAHEWRGNVLHAKGSVGEGTVTLEHQKVIVDIDLNTFGEVARSQIQRKLEDEFKQLRR